jgi:nitroimidazol reductase NimA-like FMN-containing flavoprotein (pyridoxamine 5'-phosphate oxidase superfamily)
MNLASLSQARRSATGGKDEPQQLETLSASACRALLEANSVGRLALVVDGEPVVYPVNYVVDGSEVVLRTNWSGLTTACLAKVALEIDGADHARRSGWSVLVQGVSHDITEALDLTSENLQTIAVSPWAPGPEPRLLRLVPTKITGHHFGPAPQG